MNIIFNKQPNTSGRITVMTETKMPNWLFQIEVLNRGLALLEEYARSNPDKTDHFLQTEIVIALEECSAATEALTNTLNSHAEEIAHLNALLKKRPVQTIH